MSPLACHVPHVVSLRTKEEMGWPNAWWVITMVQNAKLLRDAAYVDHPRNAMGVSSAKLAPLSDTHGAVPIR